MGESSTERLPHHGKIDYVRRSTKIHCRMRVHVKICGITSVEDARSAVRAGASAIGLVFYHASPRCIALDTAAAVVAALPPTVAAVGVFVNATARQLKEAAEATGIDAVQLHGDEPPEFLAGLHITRRRVSRPIGFLPPPGANEPDRIAIIKAFRVRDAGSLDAMPGYKSDLWLLDSYVPDAMGGTGARFNWHLAAKMSGLGRPIVLAGGLRADNVAEAVRLVRPHAVDVSSGVESEPGRKDPELMRAFIEALPEPR